MHADLVGRAMRGDQEAFASLAAQWFDRCSGEMLPIGTYEEDGEDVDIAMFGGEQDRFWVLDAGGATILVAVTDTPTIVAGAQPVLDSLEFED